MIVLSRRLPIDRNVAHVRNLTSVAIDLHEEININRTLARLSGLISLLDRGGEAVDACILFLPFE